MRSAWRRLTLIVFCRDGARHILTPCRAVNVGSWVKMHCKQKECVLERMSVRLNEKKSPPDFKAAQVTLSTGSGL